MPFLVLGVVDVDLGLPLPLPFNRPMALTTTLGVGLFRLWLLWVGGTVGKVVGVIDCWV